MHVPVFLGSARLEIHLDLSFEVLGPLLQSTSTIELGTEPLLGVYQHLPEIVQLIRRPHHVAFLLLKLQSQLVELGRRCLTDPRAIVTCRRCLTCVAALSRSTTGPPNKPVLLLARLVGQYCIAGCRLSLSVTLPAGGRAGRWSRGRPATAGSGAWAVGRPTLHGGPVRLQTFRPSNPGGSQEHIYLITNIYNDFVFIFQFQHKGYRVLKFLALFYIFLFYDRPILHVYNLVETLLFSTLILDSVFNDYDVFYRDVN